MKRLSRSFKKSLLLASLAGAVVLSFQNCASRNDFGSTGSTSYQAGNGGSYEGKTYHYAGQCADGSPEASLILNSSVSATLIRENCQPVLPPLPLTANDFQFDVSAPQTVTYKTMTFVIETQVANKIAHVQTTEFNSSGNTLSYSSPPFAAPLTAGNLVVCSVLIGKQANVIQFGDSLGNSYQRAVTYVTPSSYATVGGVRHDIWYAANVAAGSAFMTATLDAAPSSIQNMVCLEYSGIAEVNPLVASSTASGPAAGRVQVGPLSSSVPNSLMFSAVITRQATGVAGFNTRSGLVGDIYFDSILTGPGSITAETDASQDWMGAAVLFKSK